VVQEITLSSGQAVALQADVSREDEVRAMFDAFFDNFGTIDILVSNAGIQKDSAFVDMSMEQWNAVLGINLTGAFLCAREAVKAFLRRGAAPAGSRALGKILFISSVHEVIPWAGHANYATAKGGLMMLMKTLAQELAPQKIRVNGIAPGAIRTRINEAVWSDSEGAAAMLKLIPYGRIGEATDIAPVAVWLASDEADYITGTTIFVEGGMLLYPGFRTGG
jgi:glucose 1-dehydrogenase